jgi:hypothetical protein
VSAELEKTLREAILEIEVLREDYDALAEAAREARPYVLGRVLPPGHPERDWRAETAEGVLARLDSALARSRPWLPRVPAP